MKCVCGGFAKQLKNQDNRRTYRCGSCKHRFFTREFHETDLKTYALQMLSDMLSSDILTDARRILRAKGYLK